MYLGRLTDCAKSFDPQEIVRLVRAAQVQRREHFRFALESRQSFAVPHEGVSKDFHGHFGESAHPEETGSIRPLPLGLPEGRGPAGESPWSSLACQRAGSQSVATLIGSPTTSTMHICDCIRIDVAEQ